MKGEQTRPVEYVLEFLRLVSWVREHVCGRVQIRDFLKLLQPDLGMCRSLLSKSYSTVPPPVTEGKEELKIKSMSISAETFLNRPDLGQVEIPDVNKMLHANKRMFLTKGELARKCENSFLYFTKILEKKRDWFERSDLPVAELLRTAVKENSKMAVLLDEVEQQVLPRAFRNGDLSEQNRVALQKSLKTLVVMEANFFKMLDSNADVKNLKSNNSLNNSRSKTF